jgi:nucleotide-binding universal stress UspA family protein
MVHAYHVPFEGFITPGASPGDMTDLRKEYRQMAVSGIAKLQASLSALGVRWQTVILRGDPRTVILAEAIRRWTDLLAVGTHGRSGLAHALIGSVAEWVIQAAACDVLVARPARVSFELP